MDLLDTFEFGPSRESLVDVEDQDRASVLAFIQSIELRYVPNHLRPADFIRSELQVLRPKLINRLRRTKAYKSGGVDNSMSALADVAAGHVQVGTAARRLARRFRPKARPRHPVRLRGTGLPGRLEHPDRSARCRRQISRGAGTQSFLLLHVLHLLDSTFREQGFGWKQYSVSGVGGAGVLPSRRSSHASSPRTSEPSLPEDRRQVFVTTHQGGIRPRRRPRMARLPVEPESHRWSA